MLWYFIKMLKVQTKLGGMLDLPIIIKEIIIMEMP